MRVGDREIPVTPCVLLRKGEGLNTGGAPTLGPVERVVQTPIHKMPSDIERSGQFPSFIHQNWGNDDQQSPALPKCPACQRGVDTKDKKTVGQG